MAQGTNVAVISGRLVKDIESRKVGDKTCGKFTVAVSDDYKDKKHTNFINCTIWGAMADNAIRFIGKGCRVTCQGKLKQTTWEKDGKKNSALGVEVFQIEFNDFKNPKDGNVKESAPQSAPIDFPDFGDEQPPKEEVPF